MDGSGYQVKVWTHQPLLNRSYWTELGEYATLNAAVIAMQTANAPGLLLAIMHQGQLLKACRDGEDVPLADAAELSLHRHH